MHEIHILTEEINQRVVVDSFRDVFVKTAL